MTRLVVPAIGGPHWLGGHNWLVNLFRALDAHGDARVQLIVLAGADVPAAQLQELRDAPGAEVHVSPVFDRTARTQRLPRVLLTGIDTGAMAEFRNVRADAVLESATFFGRRLPLPAIAWFPDFQHRHMPELFGATTRWRRELGFRAQVGGHRTVMVSSEDARGDCERWYPDARGRIRVVRFAKLASPVDAERLRAVRRQYALPERYFYLPNQYWQHKNHACVIGALEVLASRRLAPVVAMSGREEDPRDPEHVPRLRRRIRAASLGDSARMLGVLPVADVAALMAGASALVNPSHFEGWSTTVEEAKALGTPMLLSSIGVHREQAGDGARYFGPDRPAELAELMIRTPETTIDEAVARQAAAAPAAEDRVRRFAADFIATVECATTRAP